MTLDELRASLRDEQPPPGLAPLVKALWLDGRGDWNGAHETAQDIDGADAAWVHAYLHRKEGDSSNAGYWYRIAARPFFKGNLEDEWTEIARALLGHDAR
jgi:hypothetical protein